MRYGVAIDWLALYVEFKEDSFEPVAIPNGALAGTLDWGYRKAEHGTRQYRTLWHVFHNGEPFADVQCEPCSGVLTDKTGIVKFENRLLYTAKLWYMVTMFLEEHHIKVLSISRVDICADFNAFLGYDCRQFIEDFLNGTLRHKGRGLGAAYFNHYTTRAGKYTKQSLEYTGLAFGSRESGIRVYMYDKTFELESVKNKPYIRDFWHKCGLDTTHHVWRLEVSITKNKKKFKDKETMEEHEIKTKDIADAGELVKLFHTYRAKYFAFVHNREGITNITREPIIELFEGSPRYELYFGKDQSCSTRTERILIKQLWQMSQTYRGNDIHKDEGLTKTLAQALTEACGLEEWFDNKAPTWSVPDLK